MGSLLDLKTNLKSLKFGSAPATDRPGGGNSGQPYISTPIPPTTTPISGNLFSTEDFLLRGGANSVLDTGVDVLRLGKYFTDLKSPSGLLFSAKQTVLSRIGVATQASSNTDWKNAPLNEGVYTPLNTLAQAGINFVGGHINKQGISPFSFPQTYLNQKSKIIGDENGEGNRLVDFYNESIISQNLSPILYSYSGGPNSILGIGKTTIELSEQRTGLNSGKDFDFYQMGLQYNRFDIPSLPLPLGASSFYNTYTDPTITSFTEGPFPNAVGISTDNGLTFGQSFQPSVYKFGTLESTTRINDNGSKTWTQEQLAAETNLNNSTNSTTPELQDFRKPLLEDAKGKSTIMGIAPSYNPTYRKTIDNEEGTSRINMRSPGAKGNVIDYTQGKLSLITGEPLGAADKINALPIYKSSAVIADPIKNDLIKFRIAAIDNASSSNKEFIHFRAFIDSFSDSYNANWNSEKYMGRGENFYKYDSFTRDINLSFTVAAQSREEIMIMYKKLNFLASNLAPDYTSNGYMAGSLVQLTLGGWCYELPGFIKSLTLDVPQESPWEIGIPNLDKDEEKFGGIKYRDSNVKEMPMICKVTGFSFTPIHKFVPSKQKNDFYDETVIEDAFGEGKDQTDQTVKTITKYGEQRFIQLDDGGGNNAYNNQKKDPINIEQQN